MYRVTQGTYPHAQTAQTVGGRLDDGVNTLLGGLTNRASWMILLGIKSVSEGPMGYPLTVELAGAATYAWNLSDAPGTATTPVTAPPPDTSVTPSSLNCVTAAA